MAGPVRHPIDVAALERYLSEHVPEIELPLDVKQVCVYMISPSLLTYLLYIQPSGPRLLSSTFPYVLKKTN